MESPVLTVDEGMDALSCARMMVERRKGYAVVVRNEKTLVGILTEWDFLEKIVAPAVDPQTVKATMLATRAIQSCAPDTPTDEVVSQMAKLGIRRMIVKSGDQVLGIISSRDVLAHFREYIDKISAQIAGFGSPNSP
jgi:signal-transduction protein with cAMP-binding, CBS, and nucleotidyltransferase domain